MSIRGEISVLVSTNHCLSSCYIYDHAQNYRKFGGENLDWQSIAFTLWGVVPLGSRAGTMGGGYSQTGIQGSLDTCQNRRPPERAQSFSFARMAFFLVLVCSYSLASQGARK